MEKQANGYGPPPENRTKDIWIDGTFSVLFFVSFVAILALSIGAFSRNKQMFNIPNILIVAYLIADLLSKKVLFYF
jgi:ABC-type transport system involved in cytochrome c biogenesis permease component